VKPKTETDNRSRNRNRKQKHKTENRVQKTVTENRNTDTQVIETYINGSRRVTSNVSNAISLTGNRNPITATTWEATAVNFVNWRPLTTFHSIKLYQNKNFTAREILKNYNALAPRFGLI
jgi:hypothetical protein